MIPRISSITGRCQPSASAVAATAAAHRRARSASELISRTSSDRGAPSHGLANRPGGGLRARARGARLTGPPAGAVRGCPGRRRAPCATCAALVAACSRRWRACAGVRVSGRRGRRIAGPLGRVRGSTGWGSQPARADAAGRGSVSHDCEEVDFFGVCVGARAMNRRCGLFVTSARRFDDGGGDCHSCRAAVRPVGWRVT